MRLGIPPPMGTVYTIDFLWALLGSLCDWSLIASMVPSGEMP
jgi:hypothetical protein